MAPCVAERGWRKYSGVEYNVPFREESCRSSCIYSGPLHSCSRDAVSQHQSTRAGAESIQPIYSGRALQALSDIARQFWCHPIFLAGVLEEFGNCGMNFSKGRDSKFANLGARHVTHQYQDFSYAFSDTATSFWAPFEFGCKERVTIRGVVFFQEKACNCDVGRGAEEAINP